MEYVDLLADLPGTKEVEGFAKALFAILQIDHYEMRESSNYSGGRYFVGRDPKLTLTVASSDEEGYDDLPYWIHARLELSGSDSAVEMIDRLIREKVLPAGFHVARISSFGKRDEQRIDY